MPDKESNVFDQLRSKQLVGVSRDNFSSATDQTFIEECNLDEFKLINVIGQATNMQSQSGPIPGTMKATTQTYDDNAYYNLFSPGNGEVWKVVAAYLSTATGLTSAILAVMDNVNSIRIYVGDWGSGGGDLQDHGFITDLLVDENCTLQFYPYGTLSSSSSVQLLLVRLR